jgi:hypothetical protein
VVVLGVVTGEGEEEVETVAAGVVGVAARAAGVVELVCVVEVVAVCFLVGACAGGRLSVYWSATGTLAGAGVLEVEVVGVVVVLAVVGVVDVDAVEVGVVDVEVVGGVSAVALVAGRMNPIVATTTPTANRRRGDR